MSDLPDRTKRFALRIIKLCQHLNEERGVARTLSNQLLRSGTSIGANVAEGEGAGRKLKLKREKLKVKEAKETQYWLDLLGLSGIIENEKLKDLEQECS